MKLLKGNIIHAPTLEKLETIENGALLLEDDGTIREVLHAAPQDFDGRVYDCSGQLIISRLPICTCTRPVSERRHGHGPAAARLAQNLHVPVEAKFADLDYARRIYRRLAHDLIANGTTRVCMFPRSTRTRRSF